MCGACTVYVCCLSPSHNLLHVSVLNKNRCRLVDAAFTKILSEGAVDSKQVLFCEVDVDADKVFDPPSSLPPLLPSALCHL